MSFFKSRLRRLEAAWRKRPVQGHLVSVLRYPWDLPDGDIDAWLASVPCARGRLGCPERRIGALFPETAPSAEAWAARYQAWARNGDRTTAAEAWLRRHQVITHN
jgi:hypothetical protein